MAHQTLTVWQYPRCVVLSYYTPAGWGPAELKNYPFISTFVSFPNLGDAGSISYHALGLFVLVMSTQPPLPLFVPVLHCTPFSPCAVSLLPPSAVPWSDRMLTTPQSLLGC